ncbi:MULTISPECIES: alpha/beta hydrolase [Exiguobacterium]|uniref:alpha/beta hydrolase n=1 Tax=Exiguobacterium TaxID=33986 RepID=UPI000496EC34|nr:MULTISPECIES: alpha/beta fold hydrolase [Exiguobacterium]TCI72447.1 alpha/beta fold hydrolase [Exiguobacterium sp. IPCI3]TCI81845.1 alpha/beta fold hydrolase [Exiguobacterium sp. IPCH1]TCI83351.1 alpha/beta fold hydrolase [Exiguobacterium sp. IPBC4]
MNRWVKYMGIAVGVLVLVAFLAVVGISAHIGDQLTSPERETLTFTPKTLGVKYENITIESEDQQDLYGWWIPHPTPRATIVFAHGYGKNREQSDLPLKELIPEFHEQGYQFLTFDFRGSGISEGDRVTVGAKEQSDLAAAIAYAKERSDGPIVLYGVSMGAATALATADETDVAAVIADSPFSDLRGYLETNLPVWSDLPNFPFTPVIMTVTPWFTGLDADVVKPIDDMAQIEAPVLLIHSQGDDAIPVSESEQLAKAGEDVELWVTENDGHVQSHRSFQTEYRQTVFKFLERVL